MSPAAVFIGCLAAGAWLGLSISPAAYVVAMVLGMALMGTITAATRCSVGVGLVGWAGFCIPVTVALLGAFVGREAAFFAGACAACITIAAMALSAEVDR